MLAIHHHNGAGNVAHQAGIQAQHLLGLPQRFRALPQHLPTGLLQGESGLDHRRQPVESFLGRQPFGYIDVDALFSQMREKRFKASGQRRLIIRRIVMRICHRVLLSVGSATSPPVRSSHHRTILTV